MAEFRTTGGWLAGSVAVMLASGSALAAGLPPVNQSVIVADPNGYPVAYDVKLHTASLAQYGASASSSFAPDPTASASGTSQGTYNGATANLFYYFSFSAPVGQGAPLIDLTYSYAVQGVNGGTDNSSDNTSGVSIKVGSQYALDVNTRGSASATDQVWSANLTPGTQYEIELIASAYGGGSSAFVDPTLSVDPGFLASSGTTASQYSFSESAGVGNGDTSVPEPGSLALLGAGLAGLALLRRPRRA